MFRLKGMRASMVAERLAVALGSAVFLHLVFFRKGAFVFSLLDQGDGGLWLDAACRVLDGQVMYRDFFEYLTPGVVYFNAAVLRLAGETMGAVAYAWLALGVGSALLMHALAARCLRLPWRLLPPAALVVLLYAAYGFANHKWPALLLALAGLLVLAPASARWRCGVAGALFGCAALFTQDMAAGVLLGTAVFLAFEPSRMAALAALLAGFALPVVLVMGLFAALAGLSTIVYDCIVFPLTQYLPVNVASRLDVVRYAGPRSLTQLVLALGGLLASGLFWRRHAAAGLAEPEYRCARLTTWAGLGMFALTWHRGISPVRLAMQASLLLFAFTAALAWLAGHPRRALRLLAMATAAMVVLGLFWGSLGVALARQLTEPLVRERHRAGEVWVSAPLVELSWLEAQTAPNEVSFVLPVRGGYHFLSRTRSASSVPYLLRRGFSPPGHVLRALEDIRRARPRVGLWFPRASVSTLAPLYEGLTRDYEARLLPGGAVALTRR